MTCSDGGRPRRAVAGLLGLALGVAILASADPSLARTETIRWMHPSPSQVAGFRLTYVFNSAAFTTVLDLGAKSPVDGVYEAQVTVPDGEDVYFTMTAYDAQGRESVQSNVILRSASGGVLGKPGRPEVVSSQ